MPAVKEDRGSDLGFHYKHLPDGMPDFLYVDGPALQPGRKICFDALHLEARFRPDFLMVVDGRYDTVRYLREHLTKTYRVTRNRNPFTSVWIPRLGVVALIGSAVFLFLGFLEVRDIGREYLASGERSLERAEALLDDARDGGALRWINIGSLFTAFLSGVWVSLASLEAMRTGLLTRFLGIFGIGAGLATAISFPVGPFLFIGWLGSVAILALGWWPGGRPPAWEEGRAVGWDEVDAREGRARRARREKGSL